MATTTQPLVDDQLDTVQHPTLGVLRFPKDMPEDERNESIDRAEQANPVSQQDIAKQTRQAAQSAGVSTVDKTKLGVTPEKVANPIGTLQSATEGLHKGQEALTGAEKSIADFGPKLGETAPGKAISTIGQPIQNWEKQHPEAVRSMETVSGLPGGIVSGAEEAIGSLAAAHPPTEITRLPKPQPEPPGLIGKMIAPEVAPGMGEEATRNMQDIQARRGTESLFKAAAPSSNDLDFRERLSQAAPDLSQLAKEKPLMSGGGIINPDFRPREFIDNLSNYMDNLWNTEYAPQIKELAEAPAPLDEVKQSMRRTITQVDKEKQPGLVQSLEDELNRMPERETVSQLEARRVQLSDKLNRYYKASPSDQVAMENQNFSLAATKAEYDSVLSTLDRTLKMNGYAGGMGPRGRYGNLAEVRNYIGKQVNPTEQATIMQHIGQVFFRRGPERLITGALANPSAGRQVGKGLGLLGKSSLAPEITPGLTEPFPRPKLLPESTGTQGLTPMERGPEQGAALRPGIVPAGGTRQRATIAAPISSLETSVSSTEPREIRTTPWGHQVGKPLTNIQETQESENQALRVLRDQNATEAEKQAARDRLKHNPSAQEKTGPVTQPNKKGRFGKENIGRPVIR